MAGSSSMVGPGGTITSGPFGSGSLIIGGGPVKARKTLQARGTQTVSNPVTILDNFSLGGGSADNLTLSGNINLKSVLSNVVNITNSGLGINTLPGVISGSGIISQASGTLILSGANTYHGRIDLNGGTLVAGSSSVVGPGGSITSGPFGTGPLTLYGGTLQARGTQTVSNPVTMFNSVILGGGPTDNLTLTGKILVAAMNNDGLGINTLSGVISGSGIISQNSGTLVLSGVNTYHGRTDLNGGTLVAGSSSVEAPGGGIVSGPFGTGSLIIGGGTLQARGTQTVSNPVTMFNSVTLGGGAADNLTLSGNINLNPVLSNVVNITNSGLGINTLSGAISGYGTISQDSGTLILTGNSRGTFSGTATVNGGTLSLGGIGANSASGQLGGTIIVNSGGTFNLTSTNAAALAAGALTVNGGGKFNMGPGTLYSTGGAAFNLPAGATFTSAGTSNLTVGLGAAGFNNSGLATVNGTVTGDFNNAHARAFLLGTGTITGHLTNRGMVFPGYLSGNFPGNIPGVLTLGSYTAKTGSNTELWVASTTNYSRIVSTKRAAGAITLKAGSTVTPRLVGSYRPPPNQVFANVLQATGAGGTVTGTFSTVTEISPTWFWQMLYRANSVDLKAVDNFSGANLNLNPSQDTVGNMLNAFATVTSGDTFGVLSAIDALATPGQVRDAYNEILPLKYTFLPSLTFPVTHMQFQYLRNRMNRLREGAEFGGEFMSSLGFGSNPGMLLAANNVISDAGNPLIRHEMASRWGAYLDPLVNWGSQNTINSQPGFDYTNAGFTLGADYWLMRNLLVGLNTGYNHTGTGIRGTGGSIEVNSIPFNAYTSFFIQGLYVNGILGYTRNDYYDVQRNIVFGTINRTARTSTSGNQFQLAAETGYDFKAGNAIFGPTLSLYYLTMTTDAFTESNAGSLNLRVPSQTADSVQTGLGARAALKAKVGNIALVPQVSAVWQHEYSDNTRGVNARLAQGSSFISFQTKEPGRDFAAVGVYLSAKFAKNITANVGYNAEVGRRDSSNMGVNVDLRIAF